MCDRTELAQQNLVHSFLRLMNAVYLGQQLFSREVCPGCRHIIALKVCLKDSFQVTVKAFES